MHAVGEVDVHAVTGRVLRALTRDQLQWSSLGGVYDEFYFPDLGIDFPDNQQRFEDNLREAFPAEADGTAKYLRTVREVSGGMRRYYLTRAAARGGRASPTGSSRPTPRACCAGPAGGGHPSAAARADSTSPAGASTRTVACPSPRLSPRLTMATGIPRAAARSTKR